MPRYKDSRSSAVHGRAGSTVSSMAQSFDRSRWTSSEYPPSTAVGAGDARPAGGDTMLATQLLRDEHEYLDDKRPDIGRAVSSELRELFVSADPADALRLQFEHLAPQYVALHDIACGTSKKLLAGVAAVYDRPVQRLEVRRQGFGTSLATIRFVDCPSANGQTVRLYATDVDADTATRQALAGVLMSHATLCVYMVGELPPHAMAEQFKRLRDQMFATAWACRHLQFMPLTSLPSLAEQASELGHNTGAQVRVTPQVTRPADAWTYLTAAWNQLQGLLAPDGNGALLNAVAAASPARPRAAAPMPTAQRAAAPAGPGPLERLVNALADMPGVVSCCVFEISSSRALAQLGMEPAPVELARRGTMLLAAANNARKQLGILGNAEEVVVSGGRQGLAVRVLTSRPELAVHIAFSPVKADWPALRPNVMALDAAVERRESI
jgi:hypothetical protein